MARGPSQAPRSGQAGMQSTIYRMYGAEFSLYSGELKSYLRKKGLDFEEIQPSLLTYKRFIVPHIDVGCLARSTGIPWPGLG